MKNQIIALIVLCFFFGMVFLLKPPDLSNLKYKIGVLIPGSVEFFAVQKKGLDRAAKKYGLNLIYSDANWDTAKQFSQAENFISRKVDLILLCSVDNLALQSIVPKIQKSGIPLMTFSNTIGSDPHGEFPGVKAHIGRDEIKSGQLLGNMLEILFKNRPVKILFIQGAPGTSAQRMREQGFLRVVSKHKNWSIISHRYVSGWTKEGALNAVEDFLQTKKHIDAIVTQWWSASIAAAMALKEKNIQGVKIIGLEFSKELVPYLQSSFVSFSTYFSIMGEGFKAVETAALFLEGREIRKFVEIEPILVNKSNLMEYQPEL